MAAAYFQRAGVLQERGEFDHAMADFEQVIRNGANGQAAYYQRGLAYRAKVDHDHAIIEFSQAIKLDAKDPQLFLMRGLSYREKGELDRAIADFDQALKIDAKLVEALVARGVAYGLRGDDDRAIADFTQAITLDPKHATALNNRGFALRNKGEEARALADFNAALKLKPNYVTAYFNRGNAAYDRRDYDAAIKDFDAAIKLKPDFAAAYIARGLAYDGKEQPDAAIADYSMAIKLDAKNATAFNSRGFAYESKGDVDRAVADYNRAIELDPNYALAFYNRGMALHAKRKFDAAMADINQAIKLNPNYGKAFTDRGVAAYDRRAFDRTVAEAQAADKPAFVMNFGDRTASYGNRREGDRIIQDPHKAIKNNHYNAFAYTPPEPAPVPMPIAAAPEPTKQEAEPEPALIERPRAPDDPDPPTIAQIDRALRRYSIWFTPRRGVALVDIVAFSRVNRIGQAALLNSLAFSFAIAQRRFRQFGLRLDIGRSTTGDGFYLWNRRLGAAAEADLLALLLVALADNRLSVAAGEAPAPRLRAAFTAASHFSFYQPDGEGERERDFIVGEATIALARMLEGAAARQILIGAAAVPLGDAESLTTAVQERLDRLAGVPLLDGRIETMRFRLTGGVRPVKRTLRDKHGFAFEAYNARVDVRRAGETPVSLGAAVRAPLESTARR